MIKAIFFENQNEYNKITNILTSQNINIWNIHQHKNKNLLSYFYNEDFINIDLGININDLEGI